MNDMSAFAQNRRRRKRMESLMLWGVLCTFVVLTSWAQYVLFDFAQPWIRVVSIAISWGLVIGIPYLAFIKRLQCSDIEPLKRNNGL